MPENEARSLLERHGVPEDVIDGVLCLHGNELADRLRVRARDLRQGFMTDAAVQFEKAADLIDPEAVDRA